MLRMQRELNTNLHIKIFILNEISFACIFLFMHYVLCVVVFWVCDA